MGGLSHTTKFKRGRHVTSRKRKKKKKKRTSIHVKRPLSSIESGLRVSSDIGVGGMGDFLGE